MEAWKDELYHYGIKGMRWGKKKKQAEWVGREYEANARKAIDSAKDIQNYYGSSGSKVDMNTLHKKIDHMNHEVNSMTNSSKKVQKLRNKYAKKTLRYGGYTNLLKAAYSKDLSKRRKAAKKFQDNVKKKTRRETHRRVQIANAKYYLKSKFSNNRKR